MAKARDSTEQVPPPDLRAGAEVVGDDSRHGFISEVMAQGAGHGQSVRISWDDGAVSFVSPEEVTVADGVLRVHASDAPMETASSGKTSGDTSARRMTVEATGEDVVVPIVEERLAAQTQWREAGSVHLRVRTEQAQQTVTARPVHEELEIEEVVIGRELADGDLAEPRTEGDTTIIPIIEEQPVVVMRRIVTKELRVIKRRVSEARDFDATVKRTVVETDSGGLGERVHQHEAATAAEEMTDEAPSSSLK
jgi:uncharacterized protein (TIGR02271 family)